VAKHERNRDADRGLASLRFGGHGVIRLRSRADRLRWLTSGGMAERKRR
jgi:hypothetical protein